MMRRAKGAVFFSVCAIATVVAVSLLFVIVGVIFSKGISAFSVTFLTEKSTNFGETGGVFFQILGTIILITSAGILSLPVALGTAVYQTEYLWPSFRRAASVVLYALNGVPTIIFGLFGYAVFGLLLNIGVSWVCGSFILSIMILPTLTVSIKDAIDSIPVKYRESALSLGFSKWKLIRVVIIPHSIFGVVTGLLLGLARAAGETAAIMFTATVFSGVDFPRSFHEPVATLQTHILVLAQEALNPQARTNAWGAALALVMIVFFISIVSMFVRSRIRVEAKR